MGAKNSDILVELGWQLDGVAGRNHPQFRVVRSLPMVGTGKVWPSAQQNYAESIRDWSDMEDPTMKSLISHFYLASKIGSYYVGVRQPKPN